MQIPEDIPNSEGTAHSIPDFPNPSALDPDTGAVETSAKTLSDNLDQIRRHLRDIKESIQNAKRQAFNQDENIKQIEHIADLSLDEQTINALGAAGEDEIARLRDLNIMDDTMEIDSQSLYPEALEEESILESSSIPTRSHWSQRPAPLDNMKDTIAPPSDKEHPAADSDQKEEDFDKKGDITNEDLERQLAFWRSSTKQSQIAEDLWRNYLSFTQDMSWLLCEQLRLILEPTQATRLRGDYRSGKRLNMKKIIPYVASEFTKDKIWLRRTKPSRREYQVLIALDDSRSMSESHSEHLAFQALALVSKALTKLEAGELSIVKFGESVDILHRFEDGQFNDATGVNVVRSFDFDQTSTDVLGLVESTLRYLEAARRRKESSSMTSGALWQLEIIISDGICSHHDKIRSLLRRAIDRKIMVVFIIVDSLNRSQNHGSSLEGRAHSIELLKQVRSDLSVERYLDTFPFRYFTIIRTIDMLPDVLCSTLRQFFERMAVD